MIGHEAIHFGAHVLAAALHEVVVQVFGGVFDPQLLLLYRAGTVERTQRQRARAALPCKLLQADGLGARLRGEGCGRRAGTTAADDYDIIVVRGGNLFGIAKARKRCECRGGDNAHAHEARERASRNMTRGNVVHVVPSH